MVNGVGGIHPAYLVPLFAVCSSPLLWMARLNDRHALLGIFCGVYFVFFGVLDFVNLMTGQAAVAAASGMLDPQEAVILFGGTVLIVAYRLGGYVVGRQPGGPPKDWPEAAVMIVGGVLWAICTWLNWQLQVEVLKDSTIVNLTRGFGSLSPLQASIFMVGTTLWPLTMLILAYGQSRFRKPYMTPVVVGMVAVQLAIGFVFDAKGTALIAGVIVIVAKVLVDGQIPKKWLLAVGLCIALGFPLLQANRAIRAEYGTDRVAAAEHFSETIAKALEHSQEAPRGRDRSQTFFERASLKDMVGVIVEKSGRDTPFQEGYTLTPLLAVFIPRAVWPTKPDVQTGRLVTKSFMPSQSDDVWLSPTHLGELYWNFGWPGVILGMFVIGSVLGFVGARFDVSEAVSLTRVMILLVTVHSIVLGFESAIATQYSVWLRSMLAIGVLHLIFARRTRRPVPASASTAALARSNRESRPTAATGLPFPNLMR